MATAYRVRTVSRKAVNLKTRLIGNRLETNPKVSTATPIGNSGNSPIVGTTIERPVEFTGGFTDYPNSKKTTISPSTIKPISKKKMLDGRVKTVLAKKLVRRSDSFSSHTILSFTISNPSNRRTNRGQINGLVTKKSVAPTESFLAPAGTNTPNVTQASIFTNKNLLIAGAVILAIVSFRKR